MARARRHRYELNADVNVVSLIDVMLLLLVIFMITAPMMQGGVDISLPQAQSKPLESKDGLAVTVNSKGEIFIGTEQFTLSDFGSSSRPWRRTGREMACISGRTKASIMGWSCKSLPS